MILKNGNISRFQLISVGRSHKKENVQQKGNRIEHFTEILIFFKLNKNTGIHINDILLT